jgi:hypothetical protein
LNGRRARQRRQEQARFHAEQSQLKPDEQDLRYRLGVLRFERDVAIAQVTQAFNASVAELSEALAEQRKSIRQAYEDKVSVATGNQKKRRISKDVVADAAKFGIEIPNAARILDIARESA